MRRSRRRALGFVTAVAVHLLAGLALLPAARLSFQDRAHPSDAFAPVTVVELIRLRPPEAPAAPLPPAALPTAPRTKPMSLPEEPAPYDIALSDPEAPGLATPTRPVDDDPLYRVPFRNAVAQAGARLRAGLGCAHVDLQQLPKTMLELCEAARSRDFDPGRGQRGGPLG